MHVRALLLSAALALVLAGCGSWVFADADSTTIVPNPRSGDLRTDAHADLLPADYTAPEADRKLFDLAYGPLDEQRLDLYLPTAESPPVILFLHAGGWVGGTRVAIPAMVLRFVERGYAVASVDYRLSPDTSFPGPLEDVKRAIRWLRADETVAPLLNADEIVLYGTSAGGHLAAMVGAAPNLFEPADLPPELMAVDSTVSGIISVVGPTDLVSFYPQPHEWAAPLTEALLGCAPCSDAELSYASAAPYLEPGVPPAYWAYGADDSLVDAQTQGAAIAKQWAAVGGPASSWFDLIAASDHNVDPSLVNQRWVERFVDLAVGRPTAVDF